MHATPRAPAAQRGERLRFAAVVAFLAIATVFAHAPALTGGFVWDDDAHVTANRTLTAPGGLRRIWLEPGATPQYYPLTFSTFWIERRLFGLDPFPYHLVNVLLHAGNAVLVLLVLRHLELPGAALAAALFALHPVHVESVAWIAERKNVLSGFFYLLALLVYLRGALSVAGGPPTAISPGPRLAAAGLFACALLSKTVTCTLPVAILIVLWWKRGDLPRGELRRLAPFFAAAVGAGLVTLWMERVHVGALGVQWSLSPLERVLVAGRALWFYAHTLVWPARQSFIHPRWEIDAGVWWQYVFPALALVVVGVLFRERGRLGRGPLAAVLFTVVTLAPTLGFVDFYPMRYSFVADHFQYLASLGPLVLAAALLTRWSDRLPRLGHLVLGAFAAAAPLLLGLLVWQQSHAYRDAETLWRDTLAKNPAAVIAHLNLGTLLVERGAAAEAIRHFRAALALEPDAADVHNNLGLALAAMGERALAIEHYTAALAIEPRNAPARNNLANVLVAEGRVLEAAEHYAQAIRLAPGYAEAHGNLANSLLLLGRADDALVHYAQALRIDPGYADAHYNLGMALARLGRLGEARTRLAAAAELRPRDARARYQLGKLDAAEGRPVEAIEHFREVLRLEPSHADAHNDLGIALFAREELPDALHHFSAAVEADPRHWEARNNLGVALRRSGSLDAAIAQYRAALDADPRDAARHTNLAIALAEVGALEEAAAHLDTAIVLEPEDTSARYQLALLRTRQGHREAAAAEFRQVLRLRPDWEPARAGLAALLAPGAQAPPATNAPPATLPR